MEVKIHIGNLSRSTTREELNRRFSQSGAITAVQVIRERQSGEPRGSGFVTTSEQSEADKAICKCDTYSLSDHALNVSMAKPRELLGITNAIVAP